MLILNVYRIVHWTERIQKCTVRGTPTPKGPFKQIASVLRRHRKLRLVMPGTDLFRAVKRHS